jgi:signal transduction histidine kinase
MTVNSAFMNENLTTAQIGMICAAISLVVFVVDIASLPLGVAAGVAYVPAVIVALFFPKWQQTFLVAGATSILTILGYIFSEPAGIPWMVLTNRLLALLVIWLTAIGGTWLVLARRSMANEELLRVEREVDRARNAKIRFLEAAGNDVRHHLQTLVLLNATLRKTVQNEKAQDMFAMQGDALGHLGDLMNSLLDITEIESGDVEPCFERVEISTVLNSLREEFAAQAEAKSLRLEIDESSEVVRSDQVLLTQVLRSLVSNAIRYTDIGIVAIRCSRVADGLRISVSDTGIGIERDQLENIFDEFYRVRNDPAGRDTGLGLGLTIVERIAKLLGVSMEVESEPGQGSTFSLLLPVSS